MAQASQTGVLAPITHIAVGSSVTDETGAVKTLLEEDVQLHQELIRKEYSACRRVSDTSYEYDLHLSADELIGESIGELALIDADGDPVAFVVMTAKGKDDVETTFTIEDAY